MSDTHSSAEPWPRGAGYSDPLNDLAPFEGEPRTYVIACSQRCGSTLLCDLLSRTGRLGVPAEYLNMDWDGAKMAQRFGLPGPDPGVPLGPYLEMLYRCRTSPEGFFGIKLQWHQYAPAAKSPNVARLMRRSRFVWLTRRDILAEAVSGSIAHRSGRWHVRPAKPKPQRPVRYDPRHVDRAVRWVLWENFMWEGFFRANAIEPLAVSYEELIADADGVCRRICAHIGLENPPHFDLRDASTVQSSGQTHADWRRMYESLLKIRPEGDEGPER